jgi:soluble lytic murein transglycosylase-like protein
VEGYPGERYAALIIEGARDYGLPEDYVRAVEAQLARMAAAFLGERQKRP